MSSRFIYAIVGAFVLAGVDLLINLLAAAIQQRAFGDQFSQQSIWWLVGSVVVGLLIGAFLGTRVPAEEPATPEAVPPKKPKQTVTVTRLQSWLSHIKVRGKGTHISDSKVYGSKIDIDTRD